MDLTQRYLAAVRRNLPSAKADDIAAELADVLASRREEREEALGRPLSGEEVSALLKDFGHPLVIAARYRPDQHLIGPEVFPFYLYTLKVVLAVGAALLVGLGAISAIFHDNGLVRAIGHTAGDLWSMLLLALALVTIIFAILERRGFAAEHLRRWTPEQLPELQDRPQSQWESALEVGLGIAFLLWWSGAVPVGAIAGSGGVRVEAAPIWDTYYLPILIIASVQLAANLMKWLRPDWRRTIGGLTIATSIATLAVIAGVQGAGSWVVVSSAGLDPAEAAAIGKSVDLAIMIALVVVAVLMVLQSLGELWKLVRARRQRAGLPEGSG